MRAMHAKRTKLHLGREALRVLAGDELDHVVGGVHPTFANGCAQIRGTTSEAETAGPCPTDYSFMCTP